MDRERAITTLVDRLCRDLDAGVSTTEHLERSVGIAPSTWQMWLLDGGRPDTSSYVGPPSRPRAAAARAAFAALEADGTVTHTALAHASDHAARSSERRCLTLWVLSAMWGGGTIDSRAPWHAAQALADESTGERLVAAHRHLRRAEIAEAYAAAIDVAGSGQAAVTRWLNAASLSLPLEQPPVTLDRHTRRGLAEFGLRPSTSVHGYLAFLDIVGDVIDRVREHTGRDVDATWVEHRIAAYPSTLTSDRE